MAESATETFKKSGVGPDVGIFEEFSYLILAPALQSF